MFEFAKFFQRQVLSVRIRNGKILGPGFVRPQHNRCLTLLYTCKIKLWFGWISALLIAFVIVFWFCFMVIFMFTGLSRDKQIHALEEHYENASGVGPHSIACAPKREASCDTFALAFRIIGPKSVF